MLSKTKCLITLVFCLTFALCCENHMERAKKHAEDGRIKEAIEEYKLALQGKEGKEAADISLLIADLCLREDTAEAVKWCWDAIKYDPEGYTPYIKLGEVFFEKEEIDSALWYYSKVLELSKDEEIKGGVSSKIEDLDFKKVKKTNTLEACIDFDSKHKDCKYKEQVEDLAFHIVKSKPTPEKVNEFLKVFPKSKYRGKLEKIGKDLEKRTIAEKVNKIHRDPDAGELPPPERIPTDEPGEKVVTNIENDTKYKLTVYYVGPETLSVFFQPRQTKTVKLTGGIYRVAAEVNNPAVNPFKGTNTYERGYLYTVRYYIVVSRTF